MKFSKEEKIRQVAMGAGLGLGITIANPILLLLLFFGHIYYDLKHPAFDSTIENKDKVLKPWEKGY